MKVGGELDNVEHAGEGNASENGMFEADGHGNTD
jgi:hypothetical protein